MSNSVENVVDRQSHFCVILWLWKLHRNCIVSKTIPTIMLSRKVTQRSQLLLTPTLFEYYFTNCEERVPPFSWSATGFLSSLGISLWVEEEGSIYKSLHTGGIWTQREQAFHCGQAWTWTGSVMYPQDPSFWSFQPSVLLAVFHSDGQGHVLLYSLNIIWDSLILKDGSWGRRGVHLNQGNHSMETWGFFSW